MYLAFARIAGLQSNDYVHLTQAILDQAKQLDYDPIKIYQWVRNNIEWQPSWGAIQNADLTLAVRKGNAFDIASLTIALLRAAQIPARYVHGTIQIDSARFTNWSGNFDNVTAASVFASSTGIPTAQRTSGGQIAHIQIEHIWVEAALDFIPSQGARNQDADTWVQFDPSFKQYDYVSGLDILKASEADAAKLAQDFIESATRNPTEGWLSGFDPSIVETAQTQARTKLDAYVEANLTDPTTADIIGGRKTIVKHYPLLPASLPYEVVVIGSRYDKIPASLQQTISYAFGRDLFGNLRSPLTLSYAQVNNEKLTLSFSPATAADAQTLAAFLPEGEITDLAQLPTSIPGYLVKVVPEIRLNDKLLKTGSPRRLGQDLSLFTAVKPVAPYSAPVRHYPLAAGAFVALNVVAGNVATSRITAAEARVDNTRAIYESKDKDKIATTTREQLFGDLFHIGSLGYFAQYLAFARIAGLQSNDYVHLTAGYGTFGYEPQVHYLFGLPRAIRPGGIALDIPLLTVVQSNDNQQATRREFNILINTFASTLEHAIPEQLFASAEATAPPPDGISAVKALQKAAAQGQRLYQIDQTNVAQVMPRLKFDSDTKAAIRNAARVGKQVITHTDNVSVPGWTGAGYIILDPITGEGGYLIGGGDNGGWLDVIDTAHDLYNLYDAVKNKNFDQFKIEPFGILVDQVISQFKKFRKTVCVTDEQKMSFDHGLSLLERLSESVDVVKNQLGVILGIFFLAAMMKNFHKLNLAAETPCFYPT